jgi:hypothetical protein
LPRDDRLAAAELVAGLWRADWCARRAVQSLQYTANPFQSAPSGTDFANLSYPQYESIAATSTKVRAEHIIELRLAVNALMQAMDASPIYSAAETNSTSLTGLKIQAMHLTSLFDNMNIARGGAGVFPWTRSEAPAGGVKIKRIHLVELRNGLRYMLELRFMRWRKSARVLSLVSVLFAPSAVAADPPATLTPAAPSSADFVVAAFTVIGCPVLPESTKMTSATTIATTLKAGTCYFGPIPAIWQEPLGYLPAGTYTYEIYIRYDNEPTPELRSRQTFIVTQAAAAVPAFSTWTRLALFGCLGACALLALRQSG